MKRQLNVFFALVLLAVLLAAIFAVWRIKEFDSRRSHLLESSNHLQEGLDRNLSTTSMIGVMRTHLRVYMNSGEPENMRLLQDDIARLKEALGPSYQDGLDRFQTMMEVLDVRMNSMRKNSLSTFKSEQDIMAISSRLMHAAGRKHFFDIQSLTSETCLKHHNLFVSFIQSAHVENIETALQKEGELFVEVDSTLLQLAEEFSPDVQAIIHELRDAYYELDESVTTIAAIRIRTLRTQSDVVDVLDELEARIAEGSLQQNKVSQTLMADSLMLARKNITIMYSGLILVAVFFAVIVLLLNRGMIAPLVRFVELLRNVTQMLAGLRAREVVEDEDFRQLLHIANTRHNEIGDVARSIENLVERLRDLTLFRQAIEGDETGDAIMRRLGQVFSDKIGLESFAIYEKKQGKQDMSLAYVWPESIRDIVSVSKVRRKCRAWRTRSVVSSIEAPNICERNPAPGEMEVVCIPMQAGKQVLGLVQILVPVETVEQDGAFLVTALEDTQHYIAETLPVLQSRYLARKLESLATEDPLTGLLNRRYLELSLDRISASARRRESHIGILMCDLDYFKPINDEFGHDVGDEFLRQLAGVLMKCVREADLVIRFGGEEFLILLIDVITGEAKTMGERIRRAVEDQEFRVQGGVLHKTISIGAVEFTGRGGEEIRDAIKSADIALYQAKENGRNQVVAFCEEK
ncbi:MAG: GGDEF domain-containing protein [Thermodesulfobacteriota bacterium]